MTLLDINNSVPADMYNEEIKDNYDYTQKDTFMGFHCGNTAKSKLSFCEMKYQKIMARTLPEEVTQGTLEGDIAPGDITFFRLQSTADTPIDPKDLVATGRISPCATYALNFVSAVLCKRKNVISPGAISPSNVPCVTSSGNVLAIIF